MPIFYAKSKDLQLIPDNKKEWLDYLISVDSKKLIVNIERETGKRTLPQNDAIHLYCKQLASELNEKEHKFKLHLGNKVIELDWTTSMVKENIWRPIQKALTKKESSKDLDKVSEISMIYEHLNRFFSNKPFCFHIPFPSELTKPKSAVEEGMIEYPESTEEITAF